LFQLFKKSEGETKKKKNKTKPTLEPHSIITL